MRFSQRIGKTSFRQEIQIESIDERLENRIWNNVLNDFFSKLIENSSEKADVWEYIWLEFFHKRIDQIPSYSSGGVWENGVVNFIEKWYFQSEWYEKYDFIEFLSQINQKLSFLSFIENCNKSLKKERGCKINSV